jgi:YVTN family beta-propeller protein
MVCRVPLVHLRKSAAPANQQKVVLQYPRQPLSCFFKIRNQELLRGLKGRTTTILGAIAVGCLLLAFAGCDGDDDNADGGGHVPVAQADTATTNENTPVTINVLANDSDADGDPLTLISVIQPANGSATINSNTVIYTPDAGFSGTDAFAYTISDGKDGNATATVTVTVVAAQQRLATPSHSTTIALTSDDKRAIVVNRESHSLAIIEVRDANGADTGNLVAEVAVGNEPRFVALSPDDQEAYVTNALDGTVSVVALSGEDAFSVAAVIPVGTEPRGLAITPNGTQLFVANHTDGTVSIVDPVARSVIGTVNVGGNPTAVAITNDGDADDQDERVFVTQFFAELIPGGPGEGFDTGKQGIVNTFTVASPSSVTPITLSPLANVGFTANRSQFCPQTFVPPTPGQVLQSSIFCPDLTAPPGSPAITQDPQGAYPNQLLSALIRGTRLFLPNIGAAPEPPVQFRVNVQALVHVVDTTGLVEQTALHVNLNSEIATETQPANPTASLGRLFGNDLVAIDANADGTVFLVVSRGGNYVVRASLDANGKLILGAPNVIRFQTGNLPSGVVISKDGTRAYANNEANVSITSMDLTANTVLTLDIPAGEPPAPGTVEHNVLVGKLAFFTALGIPDNGFFDTPIRDIVPLTFRGKQSDNGWSSCGSCHPDGLSDGATWSFAAGPRQTIPLDGTFGHDTDADDRRILNWSAVRGSNTDFNNNSRGVQGGCGFASAVAVGADPPPPCSAANPPGTPANPNIYDHGIVQGASDALDVQTLWIFAAVRPLKQPPPSDTAAFGRGQTVFATNCASCHGGAKWTKSQIFYRDNPAFNQDPAATPTPGVPLDPGVLNAGAQIRSFTLSGLTLNYLENVASFDATDPFEIRGQGALSGQLALGGLGFNVPSLLGVRYHAPYLHNGEAQTLDAVFSLHALGAGNIATTLSAQDQADLLVFLNALDGTTDTLRSAGDDFRDALALP